MITFNFKHKHRLLKKFIYTATVLAEGVKVTWTEKGQDKEVMYTVEEMNHALNIGDWKVVK